MNIFKFWKSIFCFVWMPLYIGGDSDSQANTTTENKTTNNVTSTDRRSIASEGAISVSGDGNIVNNQSTDFGSVGMALGGMGAISSRAIDLGQFTVGGAVDVLKQQTTQNGNNIAGAFDLVKAVGANALTSARDAMGFADKNTMLANEAFKAAKDETSGNRTLMFVAMAVVGVVGVTVAMRRI